MPIKPPFTMVDRDATPESIADYEVDKLGQRDGDGNLSFPFNPVVAKEKVAAHYRRVMLHLESASARTSGGSENLAFFRKLIDVDVDHNPYQAPAPAPAPAVRRNAKGQLLCAGVKLNGELCNSWINKADERAGIRHCKNHRNQESPPPLDDDEIMLICAGRCGREIPESYVAQNGPICPNCLSAPLHT